MSPRARLEEAARMLQPDHQGGLDGLCGIYATINGIRIALYPAELKPAQRKRLFVAGIDALQRARLTAWVVHDGMSPGMLRKTSRAIATEASDMLGVTVDLLPAIGRAEGATALSAVRAMRRHLKAGRPLLVTLWGAYDHTTVVVGFTRVSLKLFDSYGMRWVAIRSIRLRSSGEGRHLLVPGQPRAVAIDLPP